MIGFIRGARPRALLAVVSLAVVVESWSSSLCRMPRTPSRRRFRRRRWRPLRRARSSTSRRSTWRPHGIRQEEFFFAGTTAQGAYKSRMIVRRPIDPKRFNGTVIVEWMNASSGNDLDVDFLSLLPLMAARATPTSASPPSR